MVVKKNTKAFDSICAPSVILQYYEELRNYALGYHTALTMPLGIDLFMKKGTMAWMFAWSDYRIDKATSVRSKWEFADRTEVPIPQVVQSEITTLLANMILCCGGIS